MSDEPISGTTADTEKRCSFCGTLLHPDYWLVGTKLACGGCAQRGRMEVGASDSTGAFVKAAAFGIGAGVAGGVAYYAITAWSGWRIGILAAFVGILVGRAVRIGSGGIGGRRYQVLAVVVTYLAVASTYWAPILGVFGAPRDAKTAVLLFRLLLTAPFLGGFAAILGWVILGFAIFEAWRINASVELSIRGPFRIGRPVPIAAE